VLTKSDLNGSEFVGLNLQTLYSRKSEYKIGKLKAKVSIFVSNLPEIFNKLDKKSN